MCSKKNKLKILILLTTMKGGVGRVVNEQKEILQNLGHDVTIVPRDEYWDADFFLEKCMLLRDLIKSEGDIYDVIYTHDWSMALPLLFPSSLFKQKHFSCFHGHNTSGLANFLQNYVGKKMGKMLFVVGDDLLKRFPLAKLNYNGYNDKEFIDLKQKRKYVGWIDKDTEEITIKEVEEIAKKYNKKVVIAKTIPSNEMNRWYNTLKVFISKPDNSAGFNLCWLEAKASGVPIIIGNENGVGINKINKFWKEMTWKHNVNKLISTFKNNEDINENR